MANTNLVLIAAIVGAGYFLTKELRGAGQDLAGAVAAPATFVKEVVTNTTTSLSDYSSERQERVENRNWTTLPEFLNDLLNPKSNQPAAPPKPFEVTSPAQIGRSSWEGFVVGEGKPTITPAKYFEVTSPAQIGRSSWEGFVVGEGKPTITPAKPLPTNIAAASPPTTTPKAAATIPAGTRITTQTASYVVPSYTKTSTGYHLKPDQSTHLPNAVKTSSGNYVKEKYISPSVLAKWGISDKKV